MKKVAFWLGFEGQIQISIEWGENEWKVNVWNKWKHEGMLRCWTVGSAW